MCEKCHLSLIKLMVLETGIAYSVQGLAAGWTVRGLNTGESKRFSVLHTHL